MAKLIHKDETILSNMKYVTSMKDITLGLMFASKKKVKRGLCMKIPTGRELKFGASVTMFFVFYPLHIIFLDSNYKVVDKVILRPWKPTYTPEEKALYIIEAEKGKFNQIKKGEYVTIKF